MTLRNGPLALLLLWGATVAGSYPAAAQSPGQSSAGGGTCSEGRITNVFVDNHSVFDTTDPDMQGSFLWFFKLANTLHMDTNAGFIRREIVFDEGDCYDPLILEESERILRQHGFIASADIFAVTQPGGGKHVVVDTRDEWTTEIDLGITVEDGLQLEGVEVTEENFFGRGILLEFSFQERREKRDFGLLFDTPQILGTRWDGRVGLGRTRVGNFFNEELEYPFVGEVGRIAAREAFSRRESLFAYTAPAGETFTHVTVPLDEKRFEAAAAFRLGRPGRYTVLGGGVSWRSQIFPAPLGEAVELIQDGDFSNPGPSGEREVSRVREQAVSRTITRLNFILGRRRLAFAKRRGLDAVRGVQDVPVGTEVSLTLGKSLEILGADGTQPTDDFYARTTLFGGWVSGPWVLAGNVQVEGRHLFESEAEGGGDGLRDLLTQIDAVAYWQPRWPGNHTFFARTSFSGGWDVVTPFQLTLGGRSSIRGLSEDDSPGGRRLLVTLEDRIAVDWPAPSLLDLGFSFFLDGGRMWAGDGPFSATSDFQVAAGAGLRIGFPAGTGSVIRVDLAYPLTQPVDGRSLVFRVVMDEFLGLSKGFGDDQFRRARRTGFNSEFASVSR